MRSDEEMEQLVVDWLERTAAALERSAAAEERRNELLEADQAERRQYLEEDRRTQQQRWVELGASLGQEGTGAEANG